MPTPLQHRPNSQVLVLVCAALVALVVGVLGLSGSAWAEPVGLLASGVLPALAGAQLLRVGRARGPKGRHQLLIGTAVVGWGLGHLAQGLQVALSGVSTQRPHALSVGEAVSMLTSPVALVAVVLLLRDRLKPLERARTLADAAVVTAAAALAVWELWFREAVHSQPAPVVVTSAVLVVLDLALFGVFAVTAVRFLETGVGMSAAGLVLYVASAVGVVVGSGPLLAWLPPALACVALPLIAVGLSRATRERRTRARDLPRLETRRLTTTATMTVVPMGGYLLGVLTRDGAEVTRAEESVGVLIILVLVILLWVRELLRARHTQQLLERLGAQARTDPLTGLGNRRALADCLGELAEPGEGDRRERPDGRTGPVGAGAAGGGHEVGLVTMDLDGFKDVNRLLGHGTGDALLARVGEQLAKALEGSRVRAFRLGGDEFAVVVPGGEAEATAVAENLLEVTRSLGQDIPGVGRVALSASIGVACRRTGPGSEGGDLAALMGALELSGEAMRVSKVQGRGRVTTYTQQMAGRALRRSAIERRLRAVVAQGGVTVQYEPIIAVATGAVVGVEALARWHDDELGQVPPLEFIGIAENTGLMPELGLLLLREAMSGLVSSGAAARGITMGVNLSTLQLRMPGFASTVITMAHELGVAPEHLVVEVTESVLLDEGDPAMTAVYELAEAGLPVALDDFGTGYSSLAYLHRLPVAILKVDRDMTESMQTHRGLAIARSIVEMSTTLGLDIVAEGVETQEQAEIVADLGVPYAQGWLYGRTMTPDALSAYLSGRVTVAELNGEVTSAEPDGAARRPAASGAAS